MQVLPAEQTCRAVLRPERAGQWQRLALGRHRRQLHPGVDEHHQIGGRVIGDPAVDAPGDWELTPVQRHPDSTATKWGFGHRFVIVERSGPLPSM